MPAQSRVAPELPEIAEPLRPFAVPIDSLKPDPENARRHPQRNLDAITESLKRFGQQTPVVANSKGVVLKGNGLFLAAKALGWKHLAAVRTDLLTKHQRAYAIADNRTGELSEWDIDLLLPQLEEIAIENPAALEQIGFTQDELEKLSGSKPAPEDFPEVDEKIETEHTCPKCGYKWSGEGKA